MESSENQLPGFRSSDPKTSRAAALDKYPTSGRDRAKALDIIWENRENGTTADDVFQATRIDGIWKRVSELKKHGFIYAEGTRKVTSGSQASIFYPTLRTFREKRQNE
jgi:hypothetical protein